jgi:acyl-coenzyme A thioesterase PaaI-like protein
MGESLRTRLERFGFNLFPAYRGMGARIEYVASDYREIRCRVVKGLRTRNYVGTIYGGSIYGMVDPVFMLMLIKNLGPEYVVWDKAATIRFRKPGRETLYATFKVDQGEIDAIRALLRDPGRLSVDRTYHVDVVNRAGVVHAEVDKVLYCARRRG